MMNCNVIQDLLLLYAEGCCSEESKAMVEEHLHGCEKCQKVLAEMQEAPEQEKCSVPPAPKRFQRINAWKASLMQSLLLFASFSLLVFGVAREAATPEGGDNGLWAIAVIVPAVGFLLSLSNWYFIRLYPSRKMFSACSFRATLACILLAYFWAGLHYQDAFANLFSGSTLSKVMILVGIVLSIALCVFSRIFSDRFAHMMGNE